MYNMKKKRFKVDIVFTCFYLLWFFASFAVNLFLQFFFVTQRFTEFSQRFTEFFSQWFSVFFLCVPL